MDLAEELPANSDAAVTPKRRSWPRAALAFREGRQGVITRPGSCGRGRGGPSSDGNVTTGLMSTFDADHGALVASAPEAAIVASVSLCAARSIFFTTEHHHTSTWTRMSDAER